MQDIKDYLSYDPITGLFTRIKSVPGNHGNSGSIAGWKDGKGYTSLRRKGKIYQAHRLAWWFVYGYFPDCAIDHINEDPSDNRICNLRLDTNKENPQNISKLRRTNTSGYIGVSWSSRNKKWMAQIKLDNKTIYLGLYNTPEEAHAAYLCAKREHHPFWVENK
jgi:hypothetical protein